MRFENGDLVIQRMGRSHAQPSALMPTGTSRADGEPPLPRMVMALFALACGLSVANVYYAQPLLDVIAADFAIATAHIGGVVTVAQIGYGLGLLLIVPLGDVVNRRRLICGQMLVTVVALVVVGSARSSAALLAAMGVLGLLAVVTQILVAYAATLAAPSERGRVVGIVTSGVVLGILCARSIAGLLADLVGWRSVYLVSSGLTLLVAAALWQVMPLREAAGESMTYPQLLRSVFALFAQEPLLRARAAIAALAFGAFNVLWSSLVLPLSGPPLSLSHTTIGLFGLAGAAGALAAARAGRLADRGWGQHTTAAALALLVLAWAPIAFVDRSLWALTAGVVALDLAVQSVHVTSQTLLYAVRPQARSRLVAGYMVFYSIGSGVGSIASTLTYAALGWTGVCLLGAAFGALALLVWSVTMSPRTAPST